MTKKFRPEKSDTAMRPVSKEELANNPYFRMGVSQGVLLGLRKAQEKGVKLPSLAQMYVEDFGTNEFVEYHLPPAPPEDDAKTTPPPKKASKKAIGEGKKLKDTTDFDRFDGKED